VQDWTQVAQSKARDGASSDEVARSLIEAGAHPIEAIKAVRAACGINLGSAKAIVHRNLPPDQQAAAELLWDAAESSVIDE
jgi:ribosomal protein L7/L12